MQNILSGALSAALLCTTACNQEDEKVAVEDIALSTTQLATISAAIRSQYQHIIDTYTGGESLVLHLNDRSAILTITVQNNTIVMVQLSPRNVYPDRAQSPYLDINADGILESIPTHMHDGEAHVHAPLTYGNYLALLTRFGIPKEIISDTPSSKTDFKPALTGKPSIFR